MRNSTIPTDNHSGGRLDKLKPSDQAFTLVEVTVALAIFAIAVVVLTQSFVNTLLSLDSIETEADLQADIRFVRSQALTVADREAFEEGDEITTLAHGTARWYATIESTQVSDLFQVQLTIELEPTDSNEPSTFRTSSSSAPPGPTRSKGAKSSPGTATASTRNALPRIGSESWITLLRTHSPSFQEICTTTL